MQTMYVNNLAGRREYNILTPVYEFSGYALGDDDDGHSRKVYHNSAETGEGIKKSSGMGR